MKVAQFLSTVPDALPAEYAAELAHLQANAPPMGWNFVRRRMASELGPDWQTKFASFGHEAAAAASLGQVHRARLHDGTDVACKLQYPDMPSTGRCRPPPVAPGDGDLSPHGQRHPARGGLQGTQRTPARGTRLRTRSGADAALPPVAGERSHRACAGADRGPLHAPSADHDLAGRPAADAASGRGSAAGRAQSHRRGVVPRLVRAVLSLRRDPWRSASRQLPGAAGRHGQSAGLRRHPRVRREVRAWRDRPVRGGARQRRCEGASRLHHVGLHRSVEREDGGAEPVGALPVRTAVRGPRAPHPGDR